MWVVDDQILRDNISLVKTEWQNILEKRNPKVNISVPAISSMFDTLSQISIENGWNPWKKDYANKSIGLIIKRHEEEVLEYLQNKYPEDFI